ncbi:hypothetical protein [Nibrella viscosa]
MLVWLLLSIAPTLQAQRLGEGWGYLIPLPAQRATVGLYQAKITTLTGNRIVGILYDANESQLLVTRDNPNKEKAIRVSVIDLKAVRRVSLYPQTGWFAGPLEGAVIGGVGVGYLTYQSLQKSPPRSPAVFGLHLALGISGGASLGALIGSYIQALTARPILRLRVQNGRPDEQVGQLRPYSYRYQVGVMERIPE